METMVDQVGHLRRAYFALVRSLGLEEETRREMNESLTGERSSRDFNLAQWRTVVAELQRLNGQESQPGRPRIRSARNRGQQRVRRPAGALPIYEYATVEQVSLIEELAGRIPWRKGARDFVRARILGVAKRAAWDGAWERLSREDATSVIVAMGRLLRAG
jgi:hypothetical protein